MADVINFNKARKRKAREQAGQQAAENRVRFGRTREQKRRDAEAEAEAQRRLDGLRREPPANVDNKPPMATDTDTDTDTDTERDPPR